MTDPAAAAHSLSVVIPVYQGADTLGQVVDEVFAQFADADDDLALEEVILVNDGAVDSSASRIAELAASDDRVKPVWLSRNYGQHAATLAGCASTIGDWIVTMDEDGMHDPATIPDMHAAALDHGADIVYAHSDERVHKRWRSVTSVAAKQVTRWLFGVQGAEDFSSYRLLDGYGTRALAAYCGHGVYLDVALQWVFSKAVRVTTHHRREMRSGRSGYSIRSLLSHFRRMMLTAGPRPLRVASLFGFATAITSMIGAVVLIVGKLAGWIPEVPGWTSVMVAVAAFSGIILLVLGVVAEYMTMVLAAVSGRPPYLITGRAPRQPRT